MSQEAKASQILQQYSWISTQTYARTANLVTRILSLREQRVNLGWVLVQLAWKMKLQEYREFKIMHKYIVRVKWVIPPHRYSFIFWICLIGYFSLPKTLIIQIRLQNKKAVPHNKQQIQCQKPPLEEANTQHEKTLSFSCPLSTLSNTYAALRLYFLSLNQTKEQMNMRFYY